MVFFAVLVGDAGHRLWNLYEAGALFNEYSSERRAALSMLAVSGCGLGALCIIQLVRIRRRYAAAPLPMRDVGKPADAEPVSTSIYAAPRVVDAWQDRRQGTTMVMSSRRRALPFFQSLNMTGMWMSMLRIYCGVLPVVYIYTLLDYLFRWLPSGAGRLALTGLFPLLMLGSLLMSIGILRKKRWGMHLGYAMAVFHLLIFPIGTAAGFVMLIALMGTTPEFSHPRRTRVNRRA